MKHVQDYYGEMEEDFNYCHGYKTFSTYKKQPSCKDKWGLLTWDFLKIVNYMIGTSHNQEYWSLTSQEKAAFHLLQLFHKNFYE
jgi:hypothetical protein